MKLFEKTIFACQFVNNLCFVVQNFHFSKVSKLFTHDMDCFGVGLGALFHLYKGLLVTHEVFEKTEKNSKKLLPIACGGPLTENGLENSNFLLFFSIF